MSVTVDLPAELVARLRAEAARRGVSVDAVIADFARLPSGDSARQHTLSFIGLGASGRTEPMDLRRERAELAAKRDAEPERLLDRSPAPRRVQDC
jgi:hypothetical protein